MKDEFNELLKNTNSLNDNDVLLSRKENGTNELSKKKKEPLIVKILSIFKEPMFLLLIVAASVYVIVGEYGDGIIMLIFVVAVCSIEFIQEAKTDKFKLLSLSFDEDMTKLSYNEQKEKFKSVNYKEIGYPIDLTSKYIERLFTQKIEEKPKEEKNVQLPKETTTIRIDQPPMGGIINMKLALMVFFVSIFISYYLVNKYI